jgi:hypothetical protein
MKIIVEWFINWANTPTEPYTQTTTNQAAWEVLRCIGIPILIVLAVAIIALSFGSLLSTENVVAQKQNQMHEAELEEFQEWHARQGVEGLRRGIGE